MTYLPNEKVAADTVEQLRDYIRDELRAISRELSETTALDLRTVFAAPSKPREGMIIYADGTSYNPGSGEGPYVYKNGAWVLLLHGGSVREALTANRTYYVRGDGSDANTGLVDSAGGAFLTLQKAIDVTTTLDLAGFTVTIQARTATYTAGVSVVKPFVGGLVFLVGDPTTPSNCTISLTAAACISVANPGSVLSVSGFKLVTSSAGAGYGVVATAGGIINLDGNMEYGACNIASIASNRHGTVNVNANYLLSGGGSYHYLAEYLGAISCVSKTVTQSGVIAFTTYANCERLGLLIHFNGTFTGGTITGTRYNVNANSVIFTNGGGANYFPGNVAGTTATGGQYI